MSTAPEALYEEAFADRLHRAMRLAGNMERQELAEAAEISANTITSYLKGRTVPKPRDVKALAMALGVAADWEYLLTGIRRAGPNGGAKNRTSGGGSADQRADTRFCSVSAPRVLQLPLRRAA